MAVRGTMYDSVYDSLNARRAMLLRIDGQPPSLVDLESHGFLPVDDPNRHVSLFRQALPRQRKGVRHILIDVGCGTGKYGAWLAGELGFGLTGIDFCETAIRVARSSISSADVRFECADFHALPLRAKSATAAVSLDAIYLAVDPMKALREVARVLRRDAPFLFSVYLDTRRESACASAWKLVAEASGLRISFHEDDTLRWRAFMRSKHEQRWRRRSQMRKVIGHRADLELAVSASMIGVRGPAFIDGVERHLFLAVKR
jgi:SAM-dependent methyltransferase